MNIESMSPTQLLQARSEVWCEHYDSAIKGNQAKFLITAKLLDKIDAAFAEKVQA